MKSILDNHTREEIKQRIDSLTPQHHAQWGKMNVHQMLQHCAHCDDMYHGQLHIKRVFLGKLFGPMMKKRILKKDILFGKNAPTAPILMIKETGGDIEAQKQEWKKKVEAYSDYPLPNFVHPFFGPMSKEEVGVFAYKHADHHLRQFGV